MTQYPRQLKGALLATTLVFSCGEPHAPGPPYRAQVIVLDSVVEATGAPTYRLETVELSSLTDLHALDGENIQLFRGGSLTVREIAGSVVLDGAFTGDDDRLLRYEVEDGVIVPRDYPTLAMLSAYERFETMLELLEPMTGIAPADLTADGKKVEVFFEPEIRVEANGVSASQTIKFNAFYIPEFKQFGLAQRSVLEESPLGVNPLVLQHEFGHRIFDYAFFQDADLNCEPGDLEPTSLARLSLEYALAGINEGFADFVSFSATSSVSPLGEYSFGDERNFRDSTFVFDNLSAECTGEFYCIGTLFARSLYQTFLDLDRSPANQDDRHAFLRQVVSALSETYAEMQKRPELIVAPSSPISSCEQEDLENQSPPGPLLSAFFRAFVTVMPSETKGPLCTHLSANFGEAGFSTEARTPCP